MLREYGNAEHPNLIKDGVGKQKVLQVLESAVRGVQRLNAIKKRFDPKVLESPGLEHLAESLPVQAKVE